MVRKFAWVAVPVLAAVPSWAMALALGTISVDSALNEPFSAEIPMVSVKPGDLRDIIIHLAPNSEFRRAGVERLPILSHLRFKITKRRDGTRIVKITSRRPITEPYLDFLVELSRPSGQSVRQYTVLLDPPEITPAATVVSSPPAQRRRGAAAAPRTTTRPSTSTSTAPIRAPGPAPSTVAKAAATSGNTYGPTRRNDTLWAIAQRLRPDRSVSIHQVMIALQRANPEAFGDGNVNNLKEGYVLTLPPMSTVKSLGKREAVDEFQYQYEVWQAQRQGRSVPRRAAPAAAPIEQPPQLRLVSPGSEQTPPKGRSGATPSTTAPAPVAGPETPDSLRAERDFALERAHTSEQQVRELSGRQDAMQQRIAELERLIELRDADIAALQQSLGLTPATPPRTAVAEPGEEAETGSDLLGDGGPQELGTDFDDEGETISGMDLEQGDEGEGIPPEMFEPLEPEASETVAAGDDTATRETALAAGKAPPALQPRRASTPRVQAEPGLLDDPMVSAGLLALLGLLGGGAWWMLKKRRSEAELEEEAEGDEFFEPEAGTTQAAVAQGTPAMPTDAGSAPEAKSLLTEVDLAIAYGQYQQAEELLRRGLTLEPSRYELQEKLLEVYFKTDNRDSFESLAGQYYAAIGRDENNPGWRRVAEMGRKLFPGNPLFLLPGAGAAEAGIGEGVEVGPASLPPKGAAAAVAQVSGQTPGQGAGEEGGAGFEFDLGFLDELEGGESKAADRTPAERASQPPPPVSEEDAALSTEDLEAELRKLEMELGPEGGEAARGIALERHEEGPSAPKAATTADDESMDLGDLDLSWMDNKEDKKPAAAEVSAKTEQEDEMQGMEFDLSGMDIPRSEPAEKPAEAPKETGIDASELDQLAGLDFGETSATDEVMDELGTKMELAQAYIDMGDPVSAREILEEVLREGDDKRKREAEALIREIS